MEQGDFALSDQEFDRVKARLYAEAGIALSDSKRTLVVSRLSRLLRLLNLGSFTAYIDYLERQADAAARQEFINALTTNLTRFWREEHHFEHLTGYVGQLMKARPTASEQRLRIWSAGCSTGQEAYTIALSLLEAYPELKRWDFRVLATDIDTRVVAEGAAGVYAATELAGLTPARARLFEPYGDGRIRVPAQVRDLVQFKVLNLVNGPWPMRGPFDAIFCRNVAIYFDKPTQTEMFSRLGELLAPGAFLYIGHSENPGSGASRFRGVGKTVYQLTAPARARNAA
jgi:chemotaxis protein methyltransferase CheR